MDKINEIRRRFEKDLLFNSSAYDPIDIERVRSEEWQVRRFLLAANGSTEKAYQKLTEALSWKKRHRVHQLVESDYPKEMFEMLRIESLGFDHEGSALLWESYRYQGSFPELDKMAKSLIALMLEKVDRIGGEKGFIILADFGETSYKNYNVKLINFRLNCLRNFFPMLVKRIVVINTSLVGRTFVRLLMRATFAEFSGLLHFCTSKELKAFISEEYIHQELGGARQRRYYPEKALPLREMYSRFSLTKEFVDFIYETHINVYMYDK